MSDSKKKILEMLAENKIDADEAYRLMNAVESDTATPAAGEPIAEAFAKRAKYLRVTVNPDPARADDGKVDRINIRVPISLLRAGIKLTSLIPPEAREKVNGSLQEKGFNFDVNNIKKEDLDELIEALGEMEIDVDSAKGEKIKVFVE